MTSTEVWRAKLKKNLSNCTTQSKVSDLYLIKSQNVSNSLIEVQKLLEENIKMKDPKIVIAPHTIRFAETINLAVAEYCTIFGVSCKTKTNALPSHKVTIFPCKTDDNPVHQMIIEFINMFELGKDFNILVHGCYGVGDNFSFSTVFTGVYKLLGVLSDVPISYNLFIKNISLLSTKYPIISDLAEIDVIFVGSQQTFSHSLFRKCNGQLFYKVERVPCTGFFRKTFVFYVNVLASLPVVSYMRLATSYRYSDLVQAFQDMEEPLKLFNTATWATINYTARRVPLFPENSMRMVMSKVILNLFMKSKIIGGDLQPRGFFIFATEEQKSSNSFITDILKEFISMKVAPYEVSVQLISQGVEAQELV